MDAEGKPIGEPWVTFCHDGNATPPGDEPQNITHLALPLSTDDAGVSAFGAIAQLAIEAARGPVSVQLEELLTELLNTGIRLGKEART